MATTILDLPSELVASIFNHNDDASFLAGRLANRHLEQASFSFFGKRFFRKKGFMITTASLDVLQCIAAHEKLRLYVQHVWFNPDCYTYGPPLHLLGFFDRTDDESSEERLRDRYSEHPITNRKHHQAHATCVHDHEMLLYSDTALANRLTTAFFSFPNLMAVGMRRSTSYNPWGWSQLRDAVGRDPRELGEIPSASSNELSGPTLLYTALIQALGVSGATIRRFYTDVIELDDVPLHKISPDVLSRACKSFLYLEINTARYLGDQPEIESSTPSLYYGKGLVKLLEACPGLRELGLMIFPQHNGHHYSVMTTTRLSVFARLSLSNLRRVKLENLITKSKNLIGILQLSASNLTSIKLRNIRLIDDESGGSSSIVSADTSTERPWAPIFSFLATSCTKLSYLLLYHVSTTTGAVRFVQNLPPPPEQDPESAGFFTDYKNITVEAGIPHNDPDAEGAGKHAAILKAREAVGRRTRELVEGHWYGRFLFSYEMDEMVWHTDTSDEEW